MPRHEAFAEVGHENPQIFMNITKMFSFKKRLFKCGLASSTSHIQTDVLAARITCLDLMSASNELAKLPNLY